MIKTPLSTMIGGAFWTPKAMILGGTDTSKTFDRFIQFLFANGEQGFFYDPNDMSTMFQDAAGTVPVTGAGQPVGLMLDKSKGLVLSAERLQNGDFSAGGANWIVTGADDTHIVTFADGKLRYQSDTTSPSLSVYQGGVLVIGRWHEVTINCSNYVSGSLKIDAGNGGVEVVSGLGTFTTKILANNTTFTVVRNSANVDLTIDSISVREISGNHAYQTTSSMRPILRQNATTSAYYLEFDGSDDFLRTSSIDFTSTYDVSLFTGARKLSDTITGIFVEFSAIKNSFNGVFALFAPGAPAQPDVRWTSKGTVESINTFTNIAAPYSFVATGFGSILNKVSNLRINGTANVNSGGDQGTGAYGNYPLYIGRRGGTTLPFNGHIYSLIGVGRLTTESEIATIEKELAKRTGVTLSV